MKFLLLFLFSFIFLTGCNNLTIEEEREAFVSDLNLAARDIEPSEVYQVLDDNASEIERLFEGMEIVNEDHLRNPINRSPLEIQEDMWDLHFFIDDHQDMLLVFVTHWHTFERHVSSVTLENYERIENGMTLGEVSEIFGYEGTIITGQGANATREFADGNRASDGLITIEFSNNEVTSVSQFGLN